MGPFIASRLAQGFCRTSPVALLATASLLSLQHNHEESSTHSICEESSKSDAKQIRVARKQTTLQQASANGSAQAKALPRATTQRFNTKKELDEIRAKEKDMLLRWERDEDGWRDLPARAWPAYQPNPEQLKGIQAHVKQQGCSVSGSTTNATEDDDSDLCIELIFNSATAYVFYNLDPEVGLKQYEALAKSGHVDSMVACGIILIEGMGVPPNERKGIEWLERAVGLNSAQACYEMGTVLYTGIDEVLEEDSEAAFELFRRAAEQDHTAGIFMMADCLLEGEGTGKNVGRAIPLLYKAAERGHRYSRQRVRELLAKK
jgi:TPR repeat protein